jgi:hypothetical protein
MKKSVVFVGLLLAVMFNGMAQDTLPEFSAAEKAPRKILISWANPFETCIQLNVQRSFDSTKNFRTIYAAASPELPQNGFLDATARTNKMYYRIFYVLKGGAYFFSTPKQPDTLAVVNKLPNETRPYVSGNKEPSKTDKPEEPEKHFVAVIVRDSILALLDDAQFKRFRDSIMYRTKDTLFNVSNDEVILKPFVPIPTWKPSVYVFTDRDGYLNIRLPMAKYRQYSIRFFDDKENELFEIKQVKDTELFLEKSNFLRAGWYHFELYEDRKLKEKNKFLLQKDF